jgi:hypothetical protein
MGRLRELSALPCTLIEPERALGGLENYAKV